MNASAESDGYWKESQRPLTSLVLVLPMLAVYELGVLTLGPSAPRNGADVWLRSLLDLLGFGQYFLLPLLTIAILLGWHHIDGGRWRVAWRILPWMALESLAYGFALLILARALYALMSSPVAFARAAVGPLASLGADVGELCGYCGAGIYEELLFRLLLLTAAIWLFRCLGLKKSWCHGLSIAATSCCFALAHYRIDLQIGSWRLATDYGDRFSAFSFAFRFLAGVVFCLLYLLRGFGVTAGAHACYDILTVLLSSASSSPDAPA